MTTIASIRTMRPDDIPFAVAQKRREGWDIAHGVMEMHLDHYGPGCFIAELAGEPVGMITTTSYKRSAFAGNLIVHPDHRRRGIGGLLMRKAMKHLHDNGAQMIQLEADPPGVKLYRRLGFEDRFESLRFVTTGPTYTPISNHIEIAPLTVGKVPQIADFDNRYFGDDRSPLLASMLEHSPAAYVARSSSRVTGYLITQSVGDGLRIGPCVADDPEVFPQLLDTLFTGQKAPRYALGLSGLNESALAAIRARGFKSSPSSMRMIHGNSNCPDNPMHIFAIAGGDRG